MSHRCSYASGKGECMRAAKFAVVDVSGETVEGALSCSPHLAAIVRSASTIGGLLQYPVSVHVRALGGAS